jgi:hypothetical protein
MIDRYLNEKDQDLHDMMHEEIDSAGRVIYTLQAKIGLIVSNNSIAAANELGEDEAGDTSQRMYFAMQQDVVDYFHDAGCNINDLAGSTKKDLKRCKSAIKAHRGRWKAPDQAQVDDALRVIRADYYHDVWEQAEELLQRIADGEITSSEGFDVALHEGIDGNRRVFIYYDAKLGLLASDNEDAMEEEMGEVESSTDPSPQMHWAFRADVLETLQAHGVDVNDESIYGDDDE